MSPSPQPANDWVPFDIHQPIIYFYPTELDIYNDLELFCVKPSPFLSTKLVSSKWKDYIDILQKWNLLRLRLRMDTIFSMPSVRDDIPAGDQVPWNWSCGAQQTQIGLVQWNSFFGSLKAFAVSIITWSWDGTASATSFLMAVQQNRTSASIILTRLNHIIPMSASDG